VTVILARLSPAAGDVKSFRTARPGIAMKKERNWGKLAVSYGRQSVTNRNWFHCFAPQRDVTAI
jgi:hypothetical protein